ncbi:hypothetical protein SESBI_01621 [Sesbania bispinosa]|nr:hypothetical protein SESBI_01621 [Sesbania bispinosa]
MEDYLLKNKDVFPVFVFEAASWDNTFKKDPGDFPEAGVLTLKKNAKSIFSKDNSTLCSSLRRTLIIFLNRDISTSLLYEPGFGIVSMKPLPINPSKPWPDQDRVKVKKALRYKGDIFLTLNGNICWKRYHLLPIPEACLVIGLWTLPVPPSSRKSKTYLPVEGSHVRS